MAAKLSDHFGSKKLLLFVLPSVCMMVFTSIYVVADGFFVSNYAGKTAFAAVNLIIPFTLILGAVGFMIGTGSTALAFFLSGTVAKIFVGYDAELYELTARAFKNLFLLVFACRV